MLRQIYAAIAVNIYMDGIVYTKKPHRKTCEAFKSYLTVDHIESIRLTDGMYV